MHNMYAVTAQVAFCRVDHRGQDWNASTSAPTFYVQAISQANAEDIARTILHTTGSAVVGSDPTTTGTYVLDVCVVAL